MNANKSPMKFFQSSDFFDRNETRFDELQVKIKALLPNAKIEHIGASAIRGAISKGDLDVFVGVDKTEFTIGLAAIQKLGFQEKQGTLCTPALRMFIPEDVEDDTAIQLVENGSEFEFFIRFRDLLRRKPDLLAAYNRLKLECAGMSEQQYRQIKSSFITGMLADNH